MNGQIILRLKEHYKDAKTALKYNNSFELFVAVVLSAQSTDERVNKVTGRLFPKYNSPDKMLRLSQEQLEEYIRECGLYHAKAKNLLASCRIIADKYAGKLPDSFDELITLPGVGRKTANVLVSNLFNIPAIAVDTHVFRVSRRLGLAHGNTPLEVEKELNEVISKSDWSNAHHWLIWHGRKICKARKPLCDICFLNDICSFIRRGEK